MEVNRSKFIIYFISCFLFTRVRKVFRFFFVRGEQVLVLKGSSLRGIFLLSTALFVSGEVLIGACAKRGLTNMSRVRQEILFPRFAKCLGHH